MASMSDHWLSVRIKQAANAWRGFSEASSRREECIPYLSVSDGHLTVEHALHRQLSRGGRHIKHAFLLSRFQNTRRLQEEWIITMREAHTDWDPLSTQVHVESKNE